jgi:C1A family cysteine protease
MPRYGDLRLSPAGRKYGCIHDRHDFRDFLFRPLIVEGLTRPPAIDLRHYLGPIKDQLQLGACTGFAGSELREFLYRRYFAYEKNTVDAPGDFVASPLFLYYQERLIEGTVNEDSGAQIRTVCQALNQRGICLESEDPYQPKNFETPPTSAQVSEALLHRAGAYHRILNLDEMLACLASGYTFLIGMQVFSSFEDIGADGLMPMPVADEACLGGHCVHAVGYDDGNKRLTVQNSWAKTWGDGGFFYMPYDYAGNSDLVFDSWMMHLGTAWKPARP